MSIASTRGAINRQTAMLLGIGTSLLLVGLIVAASLWRTRGAGAPGSNSPTSVSPDNPNLAASGPPTDVAQVGRTGRAFNEILDEASGRIEQHVAWREMNPLPKGQFELVAPRAWMYMKDGRTLEVQAARGRIRFSPGSKQKRPESGRFEGGVFVFVHEPGALAPDAVRAAINVTSTDTGPGGDDHKPITTTPPALVGYVDSLAFDTLLNEYTTTDRVMISSAELESEFAGLRVVYNEVQRRPELIETSAGFARLTKKPQDNSRTQSRTADDRQTVNRADPVTQRPAPSTEARSDAASGTADSTAQSQSTPPPDAAPVVQFYRADFAGNIGLASSGREIAAETFLVWARLIDGRLPESFDERRDRSEPVAPSPTTLPTTSPTNTPATSVEANAQPSSEPSSPKQPTPPAATPAPGSMLAKLQSLRSMPPGAPHPIALVRDNDVLLTWDRSLAVYGMDTEPGELAENDAAAKFDAEPGESVILRDTTRPDAPYATCGVLEYGVTTKTAVLTGISSGGVIMIDPRQLRRAAMDRFTINLKTGIAQAVGGGLLSSVERTALTEDQRQNRERLIDRLSQVDPDDRALSWSDQADFVFLLDDADDGQGELKAVREAMFAGNVVARQARALVSGDFLRATFVPKPRRESDPPRTTESDTDTIFSRVLVEGSAHAEARDSSEPAELKSLDADRIDVAFEPDSDGKESNPSVMTASGNVRGKQLDVKVPDNATADPPSASVSGSIRETTIETSLLEVQLATRATDKGRKITEATIARADGGVALSRTDGIRATSQNMRADLVRKEADFTGPDVVLSRGPSTVRGTDIHLSGDDNSIDVRSPGVITHADPAPTDATGATPDDQRSTKIGSLRLTWTDRLAFNDVTGVGDCAGSVSILQEADALHRLTMHAARATVQMEPAAESERREADASSRGERPPPRQLQQATAIGTGSTKETRARVESREYAEDQTAQGGRRLVRLTYLEAERIIADEAAGVFDVPTSGRSLILDHRVSADDAGTPAPGGSPIPASNSRGTTLLDWAGSLRFTRATGLIEMTTGAELTHKPLNEAQQPLKIVADRMEARLRPKGSAATADQSLAGIGDDELTSALALGSVVVTSLDDSMRLSAARVEYDADLNTLTASAGAEPGETVEYIDVKRGTPIVAKRLIVRIRANNQHEIEVVEPMPIVAPLQR